METVKTLTKHQKLVASKFNGAMLPIQVLDLSERELEVICLFVEDLDAKEIGDKLFIAEKTVNNHKYRIKEKLAIDSKKERLAVIRKIHQIITEDE